jgi:hypothetical protein
MTLTQLYDSCVQAIETHGPMVLLLVTATISVFTRYTGWTPKQLGDKLSRIPALVLSVAAYLWILAGDSGFNLLTVSTAAICGILAGIGSTFTHDGLQAAAKSNAGKTAIAAVLLGAMGAATGCNFLPAETVTTDMLIEECITLGEKDPEMQHILSTVPEVDRAEVLHAACVMAVNEMKEIPDAISN